MVRVLYILLLLAFSSISEALAQGAPKFYTDVSPKAGNSDETYIFSVVIENSRENVTPFLVGGEDFDIRLLGPRQSTTIINGVVTSELAYNYSLTPKKEGLLDTPGAEVEINGQTFTANPLKVKISKSLNPPAPVAKDKAVLLKQQIDKTTAFLGQQIGHKLSLYTSVPLYEPKLSEGAFDGFWSEEVSEADRRSAVLNGEDYTLFSWDKALYATKLGKLVIEPRALEAKVRVKQRSRSFPFGQMDPFDDQLDNIFGVVQTELRTFTSNASNIDILALPPLPSNFQNWGNLNTLVGDTKISAEYSNNPLQSGDSKTVKLILESSGNLQPYTTIPFENSDDFRIYQETSQDKKFSVAGSLRMQKTINFSIVPLKPGKLRLPPIKLGYFDPDSESYKEVSSPVIEFDVSGANLRVKKQATTENETKPQPTVAVPEPTATIAPKLIYQEDSPLKKLLSRISLSFSLMLAAGVALIAIVIFYLINLKKSAQPLKESIRSVLAANNFSELSASLRSFLARKLRITEHAAEGENLRVILKRDLKDQDLLYKAQTLLDELDLALYGNQKDSIKIEELKSKVAEFLREF